MELGVRRIQGSTREGLGWPESTAPTSGATPEFERTRERGCGGRGVACLAPTAPTRRGEHVGVLGWELRRLWPRRREARAAAWFGLRRSDGYNVQTERKGGGFGSVAHGESDEQVGEAGGASERAGRRGGSPATRGG